MNDTPKESNVGKNLKEAEHKAVTVDVEELRKHHVYVATPCYGGQVTERYLKSMVQLGILFKQHGLNFTLSTLANESLVTRARNSLTAGFLANPNFTHIMFIDADIGFNPKDVIKLLARDRDVVVGAYPKKTVNWNSVMLKAKDTEKEKFMELQQNQAAYVLNIKLDDEKRIKLTKGLIPVHDAGTGFMMIKRDVILKMCEKHPETKYENDLNFDSDLNNYFYALFDTMIEPETKRYLSEDYTFCRRWQKMGGEIWLDPGIDLDHIGSYTYTGNISNQFTFVKDKEEEKK
jgi:hypothetical protein